MHHSQADRKKCMHVRQSTLRPKKMHACSNFKNPCKTLGPQPGPWPVIKRTLTEPSTVSPIFRVRHYSKFSYTQFFGMHVQIFVRRFYVPSDGSGSCFTTIGRSFTIPIFLHACSNFRPAVLCSVRRKRKLFYHHWAAHSFPTGDFIFRPTEAEVVLPPLGGS